MLSINKKKRSFRTKMVWLFGKSMLFSGGITGLFFLGLQAYYRANAQLGDWIAHLRLWISNLGDFNVFFVMFIFLSFLFFFLLTKSYSIYFKEISKGIRSLARGDFTYEVDVQSNDEFEGLAADINSASKKLEEAVQRGDFSESSKDQLVVNLAHDLRTPLTSVLGYLDLILKDENVTEEQKKHFLTIAFTKSQRLEKLIDELFEVTRMNYGILPIKKEKINVVDLLKQLQEELYPLLEENQLTARMQGETDLFLTGDGTLLARVFENLLVNAIRYGADGQYIDIHCYLEKKEAVVQIINYGSSIPADEIPYLFDMFYTGDKSRTEQSNSTGLGLFIAKNIIEQHHGTITATSNVIQTVFEVRLPVEELP